MLLSVRYEDIGEVSSRVHGCSLRGVMPELIEWFHKTASVWYYQQRHGLDYHDPNAHHITGQLPIHGEALMQQGMIQPGDPARNFSLKDQNDTTFDLYEQSDKRVLLSFHPLAWTEFCAAQMKSLEENQSAFEKLGCTPVGISVDSRPCKNEWAKALGLKTTRLLCDFWPHGAVAQKYGIFRDENGFSERANIIIDEKQRIAFVRVYPVHSVPDIREIIHILER
jgi:peroxiredoxin